MIRAVLFDLGGTLHTADSPAGREPGNGKIRQKRMCGGQEEIYEITSKSHLILSDFVL